MTEESIGTRARSLRNGPTLFLYDFPIYGVFFALGAMVGAALTDSGVAIYTTAGAAIIPWLHGTARTCLVISRDKLVVRNRFTTFRIPTASIVRLECKPLQRSGSNASVLVVVVRDGRDLRKIPIMATLFLRKRRRGEVVELLRHVDRDHSHYREYLR